MATHMVTHMHIHMDTHMSTQFFNSMPNIRTIRIGFLNIPLLGPWLALYRLKKLFPLSVLKRHGYIVAKSGSGKSELLKQLLLVIKLGWRRWWPFPTIQRNKSFILLDPHGDVAKECAQQRFLYQDFQQSQSTGRTPDLIFISPVLGKGKFPTLNPFDPCGRLYNSQEIEVLAQSLTGAFSAMLGKDDAQLSRHMRTLLVPMFAALLTLSRDSDRRATFFDLERFLDDDRNEDLIKFGREHLKSEGQRHFFAHLFPSARFKGTRFALRARLAGLLNAPMFVELLARERSTWDLEGSMNAGKTIIISASRSDLGEEVSEIYGRTLTGLIQSYAFLRGRRARKNSRKTPTFLVIDEAARFVSPDIRTILAESRKFGLHLVLANQIVKQGSISREFQDTILGNTALKVVGNAGDSSRKTMARECETKVDNFHGLPVGTFVVKADMAKPVRVVLPKFWLGGKTTVTARQWQKICSYQLDQYYRDQRSKKRIRTMGPEDQLMEEINSSLIISGPLGSPRFGKPRP